MRFNNFFSKAVLAGTILTSTNSFANFYSPDFGDSLVAEKFTITLPSDVSSNIFASKADPRFNISNGARAQNISLKSNQTLYIDSNKFYAQVTAETINQGKVIFTKDGTSTFTLGYDQNIFDQYKSSLAYTPYTEGPYGYLKSNPYNPNYLSLVQFSANASVYGNIAAEKIIIDPGKTAVISSGSPVDRTDPTYISGNTILLGRGSTLVTGFADPQASGSIIINSDIISNAPGQGRVIANNNFQLYLNQVGTNDLSIDSITSKNGLNVRKNIFANTLNAGGYLSIKDGVTIKGNLLFFNGKINISELDHVYVRRGVLDTGQYVLNNTIISNVIYIGQASLAGDITIVTAINGDNIGNITIDGPGSTIDLSAAKNTRIELYPYKTSILAETKGSKSYQIFRFTNGGSMQPVNFELNVFDETNRYVSWHYDPSTYSVVLKNNFNNFTDDLRNARASVEAQQFAIGLINEPVLTSQAYDVLNLAANMSPGEAAKSFENAVPELSAVVDEADQANAQIDKDINERLTTLALPINLANNVAVDAAGDDKASYGLWVSPFYGIAKQKQAGAHDGYLAQNYGGTIGFDDLLNNDATTLGIAGSYVDSRVKPKNDNRQDKGRIKTYVLSLYAKQEFHTKLFTQGIISYGHSAVKNTEARTGGTAIAKFNVLDYGLEIMSGYSINSSSNMNLVPMIGARYDYFRNSRNYEDGNTAFNLSVKKKSHSRLEGILGSKIQASYIYNNLIIAPEFGAFVNYNFNRKGGAVIATLDGLNISLPDRGHQMNRLSFDLNIGVNIKKGCMEYALLYNADLEKKYISHAGMFKVKVNF